MKFLSNAEVFRKTLEVASNDVGNGGNFTNVLDWINTYEKLTGEVFFVKFENTIHSYDKNRDKLFNNLFRDFDSPGVQGVLDNLFKSRNETCINEAFTVLLGIDNKTDNLKKFLNRFMRFDKENNFWSKSEKNAFVTENVFTQKFLSENFYRVGKSELEDLKNNQEVFSFFNVLENLHKREGASSIPQSVYNLLPSVYHSYSEKLSSSDLLNATYNNFKERVGSKILYHYSGASIAIYAKEKYIEFQGKEHKNDDEYFLKDILGVRGNCYDFDLPPVKASFFSVKSPNAAMDFLKNEFSQIDVTEGKERESHIDLIKNWINFYEPIKEDNKLALKPVEFLLEEISRRKMFEFTESLLNMDIFCTDLDDKNFSNFDKFNLELFNKFVPTLLDNFCESELGKSSGLNSGRVINLQKWVNKIIDSGVSEDKEELYIATVLKTSLEKYRSVNSSNKFSDSDYCKNITSLPMDSLVKFMNKDNHSPRYSDVVFDTSGTMFKIFEVSGVSNVAPLLSLAFKVDSMLNEMKTIKFGTSLFFTKILRNRISGDCFISDLRDNLDNPTVQSFLDVKSFRAAMSMSDSLGAKETLLNMEIKKKIDNKLQKVSGKKATELEETKISDFKL